MIQFTSDSGPRAVREYVCVVLSHYVGGNLLQHQQETNTIGKNTVNEKAKFF